MTRRSVIRNVLLATGTAGLLGSCSLALEFDECRTNADCTNAAGESLVCDLDTATCEAPPPPADVVCESLETCTEIFGEDSTCGVGGRCALLTSDECTDVIRPDGVRDEDIVWVGSILATSGPFTDAIQPIENAVQLAIDDFNSVTALADGRKVGWIACDSGGSASRASDAAEHLIGAVGVPAIIGPAFSEEVLAIAPTAIDAGTFIISPSASAASLSSIEDSGLIWRTISSDAVQANAIADRVAALDPPAERVLVLAKNDEYGVGLFQPMLQRLAQQAPGASTASLVYPNPVGLSADELDAAYATVIAEGFGHNADTVVVLGSSEFLELFFDYLVAWDVPGRPPLPPRFVVSHAAVPSLLQAPTLVDAEFAPRLMTVLEGVSPAVQDPNNFETFNVRYRVVFEDRSSLSPSPLGYDAAMVTLLSMVAGGAESGVEIARAVPRLASGTPLPLGSVQAVLDARELLVGGADIDISGVSGPLDFDLLAGDISSNYVGWDVVPATEGSAEPQLVAPRVYVLGDATQGTWTDL